MRPAVGVSMRNTASPVVDLPQPLSPTSPSVSPRSSVNEGIGISNPLCTARNGPKRGPGRSDVLSSASMTVRHQFLARSPGVSPVHSSGFTPMSAALCRSGAHTTAARVGEPSLATFGGGCPTAGAPQPARCGPAASVRAAHVDVKDALEQPRPADAARPGLVVLDVAIGGVGGFGRLVRRRPLRHQPATRKAAQARFKASPRSSRSRRVPLGSGQHGRAWPTTAGVG